MQSKTTQNSPKKASTIASKITNQKNKVHKRKRPSQAKVNKAVAVAAQTVQKYDKHGDSCGMYDFIVKYGDVVKKAIKCLLDCVVFNDFRDPKKISYPMNTLIMCIMLGWLCGNRCALQLEQFVRDYSWFLKQIIPSYKGEFISHDTFTRFLSNCVFDDFNGFISTFSQQIFRYYADMHKEEFLLIAGDGQAACITHDIFPMVHNDLCDVYAILSLNIRDISGSKNVQNIIEKMR